MYPSKIEPSKLQELPQVSFGGGITVVDAASEIENAVEELNNNTILGFDTETRPCFSKGKSYKVALLQLSSKDKAYLFRLHKIGLTPELIALLENKNIVKVGAAIHDDLKALQKISRFKPGGFVDLQHIAANYGVMELGVKKMAALVLNIRISKSQQLSNWENDILTTHQEVYAATDAWVCREIYIRFLAHNGDKNQSNSIQS